MEKIKALIQDIFQTICRYYGVILVALLAAVAFIVETANRGARYTEAGQLTSEIHLKLGWLGLLGISLLFALHVVQQRYKIRWPLPLLGFGVLAGYYVLLPVGNVFDMQPVTVVVLGVSAVCFHLLVAFAPFLTPRNLEGFWDYNKNLFINAAQTVVFTLVLWGGLALAVAAVEHLFNLDIPDAFWERLAITVLILGSSLIFSLFSKGGWTGLKAPQPYPSVLKFFVQYVLVPLLIIYLVILYSYGIKILVEWDLPKGWVSYLVLAYSSLGILSLLLLDPLYGEADKVWVAWFSRVFYLTLIPLLVLLFVAIGVRVADYGVTEKRYYVLLLALWLLGIIGYYLLSRKKGIRVIPVSLFAVGIGSLLLPFGNVFQVSFSSQSHRLQRLLSEHKLLTAGGHIDFARQVPRSVASEIGDKLYYLGARNRHVTIRALVAGEQAVRMDSLLAARSISEYGFMDLFPNVVEDGTGQASNYTRLVGQLREREGVYEVNGYDYLIPSVYLGAGYTERKYILDDDSLTLQLGENYSDIAPLRQLDSVSNEVSLHSGLRDTVFRHNLTAYIDSIHARYADRLFKTQEIKVGKLATAFDLGKYRVTIAFEGLEFRLEQDSLRIYKHATIFIKK